MNTANGACQAYSRGHSWASVGVRHVFGTKHSFELAALQHIRGFGKLFWTVAFGNIIFGRLIIAYTLGGSLCSTTYMTSLGGSAAVA